jgi:DNA-binding Lrp family transcriptional regulator
VLHHTRKAKGEDVFEDVSGTTALTGAASTTWVLARDTESEESSILSMRGRDLYEEGGIELRWDEYESRHIYAGVTIGGSSTAERNALLKIIEIGETYSFLDIVQRSGKKKAAVNNLLRRLLDDGFLVRIGRGMYKRRDEIGKRNLKTNPDTPPSIEAEEEYIQPFSVEITNTQNSHEQYHIAPFGHLWKVWAPYQAMTLHMYESREKAQEVADRYNRQGGHQ